VPEPERVADGPELEAPGALDASDERRGTKRPAQGDEEASDEREEEAPGCQRTYAGSLAWEAAGQFHSRIPVTELPQFVSNLESSLKALSPDTCLSLGSGCTGTDIWVLLVELLLQFWRERFGFEPPPAKTLFACEANAAIQAFIARQHPNTPTIYEDVMMFKDSKIQNLRTGESESIQWCGVFGAGFSCKSFSGLNSRRKTLKADLVEKKHCSGCKLTSNVSTAPAINYNEDNLHAAATAADPLGLKHLRGRVLGALGAGSVVLGEVWDAGLA
jgi:hypothetical protein